jgi:CRP-like cAMP-binding protein
MAIGRAELRSILAESELFSALTQDDLEQLASITRSRSVDAGEVVFLAGQPARQLFMVVRGQVKVVSTAADGREIVLRLFDRVDVFGELAMLDGGDRTASAIAVREGELAVVDRANFLSLLERRPEMAVRLLAVLARRLRSTTEQVTDTNFLSLGPRLAKRLLDLAGAYGHGEVNGTRIRISQEELGNLIATSRVSVNQQLKAWERDGLVRTARGAVTLLDRNALEAAAAGE